MKNPFCLCHNCRVEHSMYLLYYEKLYRDSHKTGITNPMLICESCKAKYVTYNVLFENRPVFVPFKAIQKADYRSIMWLCSDKGKERNDLAEPIWRTRLIMIKKIMESIALDEELERRVGYWGMR